MTDRIRALREAAEKAQRWLDDGESEMRWQRAAQIWYRTNIEGPDGYVAVCDPATILDLCDVAEAMEDYFDSVDRGYPFVANLGAVRSALDRLLASGSRERRNLGSEGRK
jgi:hypothetical protein